MVENILKALSKFMDEQELTGPLSRALSLFLDDRIVSAGNLRSVLGEDYIDTMLLAFEWKMIIPFSPTKTCAWEDRLLVSISSDRYEIPEAVLYVVREAAVQAEWRVEKGLIKLFYDTETVIHPDKMLGIFRKIVDSSKFGTVSGRDIVHCCREQGLPGAADQIIAVFKGLGIISPKLSPVGMISLGSGPLYEVNPSLCV